VKTLRLPRPLKYWLDAQLRKRGYTRSAFNPAGVEKLWIDVGAHLGQETLEAARNDPRLMVFAFEPNWEFARQIMGQAANYVVLPMAVSDANGLADFFIRADSGSVASSLFPVNQPALKYWPDVAYQVKETVQVPTIRLDTFMNLGAIQSVDYLKVDAQGAEFKVIQSAGKRLRDIRKITTEIYLTPEMPYHEAINYSSFCEFMAANTFLQTTAEIEPNQRHGDFTFVRS
jgi:FkbM family methyltransferase